MVKMSECIFEIWLQILRYLSKIRNLNGMEMEMGMGDVPDWTLQMRGNVRLWKGKKEKGGGGGEEEDPYVDAKS